MSTTVTYKGTTIATISNTTKKLDTKGMYCEDDITITDSGGGGGGGSLQPKTKTYTPTASTQSETVLPDVGYDGLSSVGITVNPIPAEYIIPTGTISITSNQTGLDVSQYALADIAVPTSGSEWTSGIYQSGNYIKVSPNPGAGGVSVVNGFLVFSST